MRKFTAVDFRWMAAFVLLSWLGEVIHNRIELPQLSLLSPEYSATGLISFGLFLVWWKVSKRWGGILLLGWALLNLIGGAIVSVIPFSFLPFYPEQSLQHYLMHVVYGVAQIPLIVLLIRDLRLRSASDGLKETSHETPAL